MLIEQTLTQLHELKLTGMADALEEQRGVPDVQTLPFEDRSRCCSNEELGPRESAPYPSSYVRPSSGSLQPPSRISTSEPSAASIGPSC